MVEAPGRPADYEHSDVAPRLIAALAVGLGIFLIAAPLLLRVGYPQAVHRGTVAGGAVQVPAPRLQVDPSADLAALRRAEEGRLSTYGWVDRSAGTLHVPIDRAMQITAERGLPGWTKR
jgi:hypothetical protein